MINKSKVVVLNCESYDNDIVYNTIKRGIELLGGIEKFVKKDEKILIKPNFLAAKKPEDVVTTHPSIFKAIIKLLKENGYNNLSYGDSPATANPINVAKVSGLDEIAQENNIIFGDFQSGQSVRYPNGRKIKVFDFANAVVDNDAIISLPKMKTHALTRITGAIKNQFGLIYGLNKSSYHSRFPVIYDFSEVLLDINEFVKPRLFIMDGIIAMEGNGPKNGNPIAMNTILISDDPIALDTIFATLVDLKPEFVPTIDLGEKYGIGNSKLENIELLGDPLKPLINKDFKVDRLPVRGEAPKLGKLKYIRNLITRRPVVDKSKCIKCGICQQQCPQNPKAIELKNKDSYPKYNYNRCIRCYCCQELCPNNAITVKTPLIGKLLFYR